MLTKTSAFWLLAYADRSSSVIVRSSSRVRKTRRPRRLSIIVRSRRATASVTSFSSVPRPPCAPSFVAAVAGIDHDRAHAGRGHRDRGSAGMRRRRRRGGDRGAGGGAGGSVAGRQQLDHDSASCSRRAARSWRDACRTSARSTRRTLVGVSPGCSACRKSCGGSDGRLRSSASASKVTDEPAGLDRDARGRRPA